MVAQYTSVAAAPLPGADRQATLHDELFPGFTTLLALIQAAGWPIWPLIIASILALAIIFERFYSLRRSLVAPAGLLERTLEEMRRHAPTPEGLRALSEGSPLGCILVAGIRNLGASRELMKE